MPSTVRSARRGVQATGLSAILLTLASASGCARQEGGAATPTTGSQVAAGTPAPDFTATDTDGKEVKLATYLGKEVILLDFCATWCEPCVAEFPHLRRIYEANKAKGLVVLAISMDGPETVPNLPAYTRKNQLNFPLLVDADSRIASLYNPKKAAPLAVIIDRSGKITAVREGYSPGDEEFLAKDVAKALASGADTAH